MQTLRKIFRTDYVAAWRNDRLFRGIVYMDAVILLYTIVVLVK